MNLGDWVSSVTAPSNIATSLQIVLLLTVLTLAPSILIMMTSFTRIVVVLSFLRNALGLQQMPPNQVLIGLALFLTLYIMAPVGQDINNNAIKPYTEGKITQEEAYQNAIKPLKNFMLKQTRQSDLNLFVSLAKIKVNNAEDLPMRVVIPSFIISELKTAFEIGFIIYIPFLIIDIVVASVLMSMGMFMLPPVLISLPFKVLLFILVDGWNLVVKSLILGFR
ncbi:MULTISPECIES: flagellar type III secretion system pore protein FliP [Thermoanaerobacter]|uniref:Flagellar biosynthetic protein FliP n=3 Tax=Thermoanaerobacter TaxID=1754 RepID=I9KW36_9THEO|nr:MULTISPECIES: flagellar type III secretion system pore protein FliP [Thermoanaerobacter]EGD52897.1 flagellar biosynthetic protein FliP [Thermoanaerobacter ethanolicus JW 200]SFE07871.1 flagellar biosynthetic protein FliP [Thermoanaerobacter thermohydrosulfuricus]HHY79316.1 flagellar type III secretion system pore protein FliP [Thermoanaerobacter sp.]AEM78803.1 flagellar biosynthetic protein FliP [Thermoanaerobacter wiegelii Rt8.B1]EIW01116.1 flagellar biosynthetic protein FliP [Thermoanaero